MAFTILAAAVGLVVAAARGGRPHHLRGHRFDAWPLAVAGLILVVGAETASGPSAAFLLGLAGATALLAFGAMHVRFPGVAVAVVGLALNAAVLAANGTTPVRPDAVVAAGSATHADVASVDLGPARTLERADTRLAPLGRIVPVAPLGAVVSFGDLIVAFGLADVAFHLLRPPRRGVRRVADGAREAVHDGWDELSLRALGDAA